MLKENLITNKKLESGYLPFLLAYIVVAGLVSCKVQHDFVKVNNTRFEINDKPYYFVGSNFWYGAYLGANARYGNRDRLLRELDRLAKLGVKNLRIAAASEASDFSLPLSPPFQYKNGAYNDTLFEGLDFLLFEMGKRKMKAVLFLNNYWDWTGGMSQYVSWAENSKIVDPTSNPALGWPDYIGYSARFYQNEKAQDRYRRYIKTIINRKNIFSGVQYKDDPAIMAWQLANEPRPNPVGEINQRIAEYCNWIDQTAGFIKKFDKKHLVSIGSEGKMGSLNKLEYAYQANESRNIDYVTFHLWPKNWGWYNPAHSDSLQRSLENATSYIDEHVSMAAKLNKPAVVEEFGLNRDFINYKPNTAVTSRDTFYKLVFELVKKSKQNGSALAGCNFWAWGGEGRAAHEDAIWQLGDGVYLGDPYSEHQGLNSIYDTDSSTLKIIQAGSEVLK
ncbi:MAG: hypothetical protein ABIX01_23445 [Chitinophagaceae bacterium]